MPYMPDTDSKAMLDMDGEALRTAAGRRQSGRGRPR